MTERDAFEIRLAAAVHGYAERVRSDLDPVELAHRIAAAEPRRPGLWGAFGWRPAAIPRVAWALLLLAALLVALAGTALVASRMLEIVPRIPPLGAALVPTGIEVLTPETGGYAMVVADDDGILWAREPSGRLARFDPASGSARAWTIRDDAGFGVTTSSGFDIVPAGEGGVWLVGQRTLRWFDGTDFRAVIDAPTDIGLAVEAPDGSLWVTTEPCCFGTDGAVLHWDGSSWTSLAISGSSANATVGALAVDAAGRPWIGWVRDPDPASPGSTYSGSVWRWEGSSWTTFDGDDAAALGGGVFTITQLRDGAVWVASAAGLARFDGSSWIDTGGPWSTWGASVADGPDGTVWVAVGDSGDGAVTVAHFDGQSWVSYGPSDGLPGPNASGYAVAHAVPTNDGVYVGTGVGIYRLADGRWERAWPTDSSPLIDIGDVLAVSRDELLAIDREGGLWHLQGSAWTREFLDPGHPDGAVSALTLAPDGTVWAAGANGVGYRRDGHWTLAAAGAASAITVGRNGTVWVGGGDDCRVWTLRLEGTTWVSSPIAACPPESFGLSALAVDASGALWAGTAAGCAWGMSACSSGGLARLDGGTWEAIRQIGGFDLTAAMIVGTTPTGDVWVLDEPGAAPGAAGEPAPIRAARFDGTDWTVVELPNDAVSGSALAPDGSLWASAWWVPGSTGGDRGPARHDGTAWTFPYHGAGLPWMRLAAIAPDGAVFGEIASSVFRFPDQTPAP